MRSTGEFPADLAFKLVARMSPVLADLDDRVDALEDVRLPPGVRKPRPARHLAPRSDHAAPLHRPQREALGRLILRSPPWIERDHRDRLREGADRVTRHVEEPDAARERAAVMQEEIANCVSDQIIRNMYLLPVVAAMFLPLGFVIGLLGIDVGGIPGGGVPWAWPFATSWLVAGEIIIFRRLKWF